MDRIHHRALILALLLCLPGPPVSADPEKAKQLVEEARRLMQQQELERAVEVLDRAVAEEPGWSLVWTERAFAKARVERTVPALEDLAQALEREPGSPVILRLRARVLMDIDRWQESLEQSGEVLKRMPDDPYALSLHGRALVAVGEVDRGIEEQRRAALDPRAGTIGDLPPAYLVKGDWDGALKCAQEAIQQGAPSVGPFADRVLALVELGRFDDAAAAIADADRAIPDTVGVYYARAYLHGTPAAGRHHNLAEALRRIESAAGTSQLSPVINAWARVLFLNGRERECRDLLQTKGRRTNFETLFWLGAAYWKLGMLAEARVVLSDARRLNPYLTAHASRAPGLAEFLASIDRELAGEAQGAERGKLGHELATHLLTVAEIEALVRRYRFARAAEEYRKLLQSLTSAVRRAEVERRLPEVDAMAAAHGKLVSAVNNGALKLRPKVGALELAIAKADEAAFDFTVPRGEGKFPWAYLDVAVYVESALLAAPAPGDLFGLGCLAWDAGEAALAVRLFEEAAKKKPALRDLVSRFVGRRRGLDAPEFVLYRGAYVTPEEKGFLEKGLVRFEGQWVAPKDREQLAKGLVKVGDAWVPGDTADLLRRGYRKWKDQWMSPEDYAAVRSRWENAFVEETPHFTIRTNESESFAKDLAVLIEAAHAEFARHMGGEPKEKLTLYAFRTYEDYRRHCVEAKAEDHLNAAGFAKSDSNVAAGWNKTGNLQQFLQTMVHEAAHLFYFRVAPAAQPPSWYAEGLATYFEGFTWDGKGYRFNGVSESRLPFARDAMKNGRHIPLAELIAGDALQLINSDARRALLFYAQCWSLHFWLSQTDNREYRAAYAEYRKAVAAGKKEPLVGFFKDVRQLEKDWVAFVTGL